MNTSASDILRRWLRFNLVGVIGMALQLTLLAALHRSMPCHNLIATALATEITLLHNFLWHWRYTWRDRRSSATLLRQITRYHLSNGLVSLAGNLGLVWLLTRTTHLPLLADTVIAVLCCSLANFLLGHLWTFNQRPPKDANMPNTTPNIALSISTLALLIVLAAQPTQAQIAATTSSSAILSGSSPSEGELKGPKGTRPTQTTDIRTPPNTPAVLNAPTPQQHSTYQPHSYDSYRYNLSAFCGIGASTSSASTVPTTGCGAGMTLIPLPIFVEFGLMAPQANRSRVSAYMSFDSSIPLAPWRTKYLPMGIIGYSRLLETGHALDYGLALALPRHGHPKDPSSSLRLEVRDYWTFANPSQHNMMLRIGWMTEASD